MAQRRNQGGVPTTGGKSGTDTIAEAARLKELLEQAVASHGLFLEDVEIRVAGALRTVHVIVDLPEDQTGGVGLDAIAEVSQTLSKTLDEDPQDDGRPYSLEVSSPGLSRPLTQPRHWRRNVGRLVKVKLVAGEDFTGRVLDVGADGVTMRPEEAPKKGMKPRPGEPVQVEFANIRSGKVEVEFARLDEEEVLENPSAEANGELENEEEA